MQVETKFFVSKHFSTNYSLLKLFVNLSKYLCFEKRFY